MSSIDQAFVKAYARRQLSDHRPSAPAQAVDVADDGVVVDRSVADTVAVWIDPTNDVSLRIDTAHSRMRQAAVITPPAPPKQHASPPAPTPVVALRYVHTAYAIADADASWIHALSGDVFVPEPIVRESIAPERQFVEVVAAPVAVATSAPIEKVAPVATAEPVAVAAPVDQAFHAKWEIDALDVPTVVADLFFDGELFQQVAQQMAEASATGLKRVLVTSVHDGEGRSTVAMGLAIAAAASGKRVALVDGDTTSPTLVDDLRLDLEFGWIEAIRGRLPLEEICVHAMQDGVTLVPLLTPHGATAGTARETRELIEKLDPHFDLIIVDGGSSQCAATAGTLGQYDSAMIVFNKTRTATADINEYSYQLRFSGVSGVGVVENFVS